MTFESFFLEPTILDALRELEFKEPTEIQETAIPPILEGKDVIALATTGSGKTAACAIPLCNRINPKDLHIQVLIIVPTRELALQYSTETQKIGKFKGVSAFSLFGGEDMTIQRAKLKHGVHILIATPGRLIDFIYARAIDLSHVRTLVMDEADQMLGMGFYEDLEFIMQCLIQEHQTLLFSATMPEGIRKIARFHMKDPLEITLTKKNASPLSLTHHFYFCENPKKKREDLVSLLESLNPSQCLIFAESRRDVEDLFYFLKNHFHSLDFLHGGLEQNIRTIITNKFSKGKIRFLIATDIASRGLDFSGITHVINLHFPKNRETYLHRSGRAGRSGRIGACITLVSRREVPQVQRLLATLKQEANWIGQKPE